MLAATCTEASACSVAGVWKPSCVAWLWLPVSELGSGLRSPSPASECATADVQAERGFSLLHTANDHSAEACRQTIVRYTYCTRTFELH